MKDVKAEQIQTPDQGQGAAQGAAVHGRTWIATAACVKTVRVSTGQLGHCGRPGTEDKTSPQSRAGQAMPWLVWESFQKPESAGGTEG